jgi:protein tyrosine/serine phosphatase
MSSRWVQIDGLRNARDLGGVPLRDGETAFGVVVRGETLVALTGPGADDVRRLGIRHVLDLRSDEERALDGDGVLATDYQRSLLVHESVPLSDGSARAAVPYVRGSVATEAQRLASYLDRGSHLLADALARTAWSTSATYVHGAAGCERTGAVSALLLELAGARPDDIVDDYLLSFERAPLVAMRLVERRAYWDLAECAGAVLDPCPDAMHLFLDGLSAHGGARTWLARQGVDRESIDLLADRLRGGPVAARNAV